MGTVLLAARSKSMGKIVDTTKPLDPASRRYSGPPILARRLLWRDDDHDAAIVLPPLGGRIARNGQRLAAAHHLSRREMHAARPHRPRDRFGTLLRPRAIIGVGADRVGMSLHPPRPDPPRHPTPGPGGQSIPP